MTPDREERKREERIRLRALEIWTEQGCPDGRAREPGSRQNAKWTLKIVKQAVINQPMVSREERIKRNAVVPDHECRNAHGLQASV
jgi:hypothetical protein